MKTPQCPGCHKRVNPQRFPDSVAYLNHKTGETILATWVNICCPWCGHIYEEQVMRKQVKAPYNLLVSSHLQRCIGKDMRNSRKLLPNFKYWGVFDRKTDQVPIAMFLIRSQARNYIKTLCNFSNFIIRRIVS